MVPCIKGSSSGSFELLTRVWAFDALFRQTIMSVGQLEMGIYLLKGSKAK